MNGASLAEYRDEFTTSWQSPSDESVEVKAARAEAMIRRGEVPHARQALVTNGHASGTAERQLQDEERRPPQLAEALPPDTASCAPSCWLFVDRRKLLTALRSAGRGSAADLSGACYERYHACLADETLGHVFGDMAEALADVPEDITKAIGGLGRFTAPLQPDDGVRGRVAGCVLRRLVGRALAAQLGPAFMGARAPFQFALCTRAGTDALARILQISSPRRRGSSGALVGWDCL